MISMSPFLSRLAGRFAILLAAGTLAACQVDVDQGGGYDPGPRICTWEYAPVCGTRGGDLQTFANACEARSSGFQIVGRGECRFGGRPDPRPDEGRMCTREYAPVCGARGRDRQTFSNACEARSSGYDIVGRGVCLPGRPDDSVGWQGRDQDRDRDRPEWREGDDNRDVRDHERPRDRGRNPERERDRRDTDRERIDNKRRDTDARPRVDGGDTRTDRSGREEREETLCADKRAAKSNPACASN